MTPSEPTSRYRVERTLGIGGMATVYLAHDSVLGREVALKVLAEHLSGDESFRERFLREARLAARVTHPNVVQIYDAGADERGLFIVMEYVEGETLAEELARRGRLAPAEAVDLGIQLCAALDAAHAAGLVHRDVKPQNVLRGRDGTTRLGDFGIARSHDSTALTEHGSVLGTAAYLAPEQGRGEAVTGAADLYSLGVLLYEALTGVRPHDGASLSEVLLRREREAPAPPSAVVAEIPAELDAAVLACLALRPEERPASAAALAADLSRALPEASTRALPVAGGTRATEVMVRRSGAPDRRRARRTLAIAAAVLGLTAIALASALVGGDGDTPPAATSTRARTAPASAVTAQPTTTSRTQQTQTTRRPVVAVSPCATVEQRLRTVEGQIHALDEAKHATKGKDKDKDKERKRELDRRKHALDKQKHALDKEQKDCR